MPRILIVEDEPAIAETVSYALETEGMEVEWASTLREAERQLTAAMDASPFDLIILDILLPDGNGIEFCREVRRYHSGPVLFLSSRSSEIDRIVGLEVGGGDYLTKPFSPRELTARARNLIGRSAALPSGTSESEEPGGLTLNVDTLEVSLEGAALVLSAHEWRILLALGRRPGRVFSRDQLMEAAWDDPGASMDRTVDSHIKNLRRKFREIAPSLDLIQTHRGMGYSISSCRLINDRLGG